MFASFALLAALPPTCAVSADGAGRRSAEARGVLAVESSGAVREATGRVPANTTTAGIRGAFERPKSQRCCCNQQAPLGPAYLCYDKKTNELFTTVSTTTKTKGISKTVEHTPTIVTSSKCGSKGEAIFGAAAADIQPATQKEIAALKKQNDGVILKAHGEKVTTPWEKYVFPSDKKVKDKMFAKYSSTNMAAELLDVHISMNGVVYGPHTTQKSVSDSLHGVPVCTKWQKTAKTFVRGHRPGGYWSNKAKFKPSFDVKTQAWTYGTECTEMYTCLEYKIGHACGFDHDDIIFLKHKGRADGTCEEPTKRAFGDEHCPSGMFHQKGNCKLTGTCNYYFCDCRVSGDAQCDSWKAAKNDLEQPTATGNTGNPWA